MLEKAMSEVHSLGAQREIAAARISIRCLVKILNEADSTGSTVPKEKHIYTTSKGYEVKFRRKTKQISVGHFTFDELDKAIQARDEFLAREINESKQKGQDSEIQDA